MSVEGSQNRFEDLSLSAIISDGLETHSTTLMGMTGQSFQHNLFTDIKNRPILSREEPANNCVAPSVNKGFNTEVTPPEEDGKHPLDGISDFHSRRDP